MQQKETEWQNVRRRNSSDVLIQAKFAGDNAHELLLRPGARRLSLDLLSGEEKNVVQ